MTKIDGKPALITYYRNEDGVPIGTVLAFLNNNKVYFGWSVVASTRQKTDKVLKDTPNKKKGVQIAFGRAQIKGLQNVPRKMIQTAEYLVARAHKYFKQDNLTFEDTITIAR